MPAISILEKIVINVKTKRIETRTQDHRHLDQGLHQQISRLLPEMQEAQQTRVPQDPLRLLHGIHRHGFHRIHRQTCFHSHQQHYSLLNTTKIVSLAFANHYASTT